DFHVTGVQTCALPISSWSRTLITGLSEFIAPWNTIDTLSHRNARSASPASATTSTSGPSWSWNVTVPLVSSAGGLRSRLSPYAKIGRASCRETQLYHE